MLDLPTFYGHHRVSACCGGSRRTRHILVELPDLGRKGTGLASSRATTGGRRTKSLELLPPCADRSLSGGISSTCTDRGAASTNGGEWSTLYYQIGPPPSLRSPVPRWACAVTCEARDDFRLRPCGRRDRCGARYGTDFAPEAPDGRNMSTLDFLAEAVNWPQVRNAADGPRSRQNGSRDGARPYVQSCPLCQLGPLPERGRAATREPRSFGGGAVGTVPSRSWALALGHGQRRFTVREVRFGLALAGPTVEGSTRRRKKSSVDDRAIP